MRSVQFDSTDVTSIQDDLAILGISSAITGNLVVGYYHDWRSAEKLRDYLEAHHCAETPEGKINTLPVAGWDELVKASRISAC
jgi:hypothetical protein